MANVAGVLAKYQRRLGHEVVVVDNGNCDLAHTVDYGGITSLVGADANLVKYAWLYGQEGTGWANGFGTDIFHLHSLVNEVPLMRELAGSRFIVLHLHGKTDVAKLTPEIVKDCDLIIAAFPSIWRPPFEYLDNPVDLEMWKYRKHEGPNCFWVKQWDNEDYRTGEKIVRAKAAELKLNLTVFNRYMDVRPLMSMPDFYHQFDCMIEYKHDVDYGNTAKGRTLGLGAMEAILCGLPVFFIPEDKWLTEFPVEHSADIVVRELDKLYEKTIKTIPTPYKYIG